MREFLPEGNDCTGPTGTWTGVPAFRSGGITLVSVMVAITILLAGVAVLVRTLPAICGLSARAAGDTAAAMAADRIFTLLEEVYGAGDGPPVPDMVAGSDPEVPVCQYRAFFEERKPGLFHIELEISTVREGRPDRRTFFYAFRRKEWVRSP